MSKIAITIRDIIAELVEACRIEGVLKEKYEQSVEVTIQRIKQKLAHLRRVMYQELEIKRLIQPYENMPGSETMSIQKPLSSDEILDIVYTELDHAIEGLDHEKKDLTDMSRNDASH